METRDFCEMVFRTSDDGTRIVRIPDPINGLTATVVNNAAAQIVNANPFDETIGPLMGLKRADLVRIERKPIIAAA